MTDLVNNSHIDNNNKVPSIETTPVGKALASHFERYPFNEGMEQKTPLFHNPKAGLTEVGGVGPERRGHRAMQSSDVSGYASSNNSDSSAPRDLPKADDSFMVADACCD